MIVIRTKKEIDHSQNVNEERINVLEFRAKKNKSFNDTELRVEFETFKVEKIEEEDIISKIDYHVKGGVNSIGKVNGLAQVLHTKGLPSEVDPVRPIEYLNWMIAKATVLVIADKDSQINVEDLEIISY